MKISVVIPSRGRPHSLLNAVRRLNAAASGNHEIAYVIGCDADDPGTIGAAYLLGLGEARVAVYVTQRLGSLGEMVNRMVALYPADVYCSLCDDVEVLTKDWDERIAESWAKRPDGLWWWITLKERPATYAIISHKWYKAAGYIFTDYFPFWWDDVWLMQIWNMATGEYGQGVNAALDDRAVSTQRMRDLRFWSDFYTFMRPKREREAKRIAKALGWPERELEDKALGDVRDDFREKIDAIVAHQGERAPPTPEYLAAKARAEAIMAEGNP